MATLCGFGDSSRKTSPARSMRWIRRRSSLNRDAYNTEMEHKRRQEESTQPKAGPSSASASPPLITVSAAEAACVEAVVAARQRRTGRMSAPRVSFSIAQEDLQPHVHDQKKVSKSSHTLETLRHRLRRTSEVFGLGHAAKPEFNRRMSVDTTALGILKKGGHDGHRIRKSVSFSQRDNVRTFESSAEDDEDVTVPDEHVGYENEAEGSTTVERNRSLVPTFVVPSKKPTYASDFRQSVVVLEGLRITEDLSLIGSVRVNVTRLRNMRNVGRRILVGVNYSVDGWQTSEECHAHLVRNWENPVLGGDVETQCLRFVIDCPDIDIGQTLQFSIWCREKATSTVDDDNANAKIQDVIYEDDNGRRFYSVSCTPKLNVWAAKAAAELKNFAPTVKFNKNFYRY